MPLFVDSARPSYAELWRSNKLLWVVCAILIAGSAILFLFDLNAREKAALDYTQRFSLSFADVLAEHAARTFEAVERTLRAGEVIRAQSQAGSMDERAVRSALQSLRNGAPAILSIGWTDAAGNIVAHSYDNAPPRPNVSNLPHFQALKDATEDRLYVGSLYRSFARDIWISSAALRLTDDSGNFAGIISAPLNLAYFSSIFRAIKLGNNDAVAIVRNDGTVLFREPFVESALNKSFPITRAISATVKGAKFGTFEAKSPIDERPRIYGFHSIPDRGLIIIVAQDRADALAAVHRHFRVFGPLVLAFIVVLIIGALKLSTKNSLHMRQTRFLEATLQNMHEGIMVIDGNSRIAVANRKAVALLGVPPSLVENYPHVDSVINYLAAKGEFLRLTDDVRTRLNPIEVGVADYVYVRQRPDGSLLEVRTVPFADGGVVRTYNDVTEQRRLTGELHRSERQFRLLAENATDIIARVDLDGVMHYISPSSLPILGYAPEELVCTNIAEYILPEDVEPTRLAFARVAAGEPRTGKIEYRLRHKDGHTLWLEANPTVVSDERGIPYELVDVMRDITERKRIEAEAALAKRQADKAAQAKGEFLASMSHELRTPLNSIVGFSNILLNNAKLDQEMRRQVGLIQTASDSLLAIVNDVLDFSEIDEGKLQISPSRFSLSALIEGSLAIVKEAAKARQLNLMAEFAGDAHLELLGDSLRLRQILLNFLNNAIKFTHEGFVCLSVELGETDAAGVRLKFSVRDSGIGIPLDKQGKLFQRFSQVDSSIRREYGGSGLGLAICQKLVELMGGRIGFDSREGEGSNFWFEVRLILAPAVVEPARDVTPARASTSVPARILLVEDLAINSEIATSLLTSRGYLVDAVFDGAEAIEAVQKAPYALVLMDVQMPGMDGITATKMIRQLNTEVAKIPIIAMTANVLPAQVTQLVAAGMDGHIGKPFNVDDLVAIIEKYRKRDAVSERRVDDNQSLLGPERYDALNEMLATRLTAFVAEASFHDGPALAAQAHKLTSATGFLGFSELSRMFSDLERATSNGEASAASLSATIAASEEAVATILARRTVAA